MTPTVLNQPLDDAPEVWSQLPSNNNIDISQNRVAVSGFSPDGNHQQHVETGYHGFSPQENAPLGGYATFNDFKSLQAFQVAPDYLPPATDYLPAASDTWQLPHAASSCEHYSADFVAGRMRTNLRKRERNLNINKAFDELRTKIPDLPIDTKVSKIKILRLASDYIRHLSSVLGGEADTLDDVTTTSPCDDVTRKRSRDDFKVNPEVVSVKRRKIDWERIQQEISRHKNVTKAKPTATIPANQNSFNFPYVTNAHFTYGHQAASSASYFHPLEGATYTTDSVCS